MICIAGKNDIAAQVLTFVVEYFGASQVVAVANRDDTGYAGWQKSLTATAQQLQVELVTLEQAYALPGLHFFSVEFDRIVVPGRFYPDAQLYNIHFSLLPRYKGVYTAVWPLLNGEAETGVTLHRMEAGIDTGPIIHQAKLPIALEDTARDIYYGCLRLGATVLREFIPKLVQQPDNGQPQPAINSTYYGPKSLDFANLSIDLRQTAFQIHNNVRAFCFQEYQLPMVLGRRVRGSRLSVRASVGKPGIIQEESAESFFISTIDFDLELLKDYSFGLFEAVRAGDEATAAELAFRVPSLEVRTRQGWTPLMIAAYANDAGVSKALLAAGANVNQFNLNGTSVFMYAKDGAVRSGDTTLLEVLLQHGADINWRDFAGKTVLDYCRANGNQALVAFLGSRGAE